MTPYMPIDAWWCCLNPRERNTLIQLLIVWPSREGYILRCTYDVIVTLTGENSCILMHDVFRFTYDLTYGTVEIEPGEPVEVVFYGAVFWSELYAFSIGIGLTCENPCRLLTFPL